MVMKLDPLEALHAHPDVVAIDTVKSLPADPRVAAGPSPTVKAHEAGGVGVGVEGASLPQLHEAAMQQVRRTMEMLARTGVIRRRILSKNAGKAGARWLVRVLFLRLLWKANRAAGLTGDVGQVLVRKHRHMKVQGRPFERCLEYTLAFERQQRRREPAAA